MRFSRGDITNLPLEWVSGLGPMSNIVITSRIRLARNLKDFVFPSFAGERQLKEVANKVIEAQRKSSILKDGKIIDINELDSVLRLFFVERHQISVDFSKGGVGRLLVLDKCGVVAIMVNEEDHLRIQVLMGGFRLEDVSKIAAEVDSELEELGFAFDKEFGYLTACPTNVGTGLRASVMLHLPALTMDRSLPKLNKYCTQLGLTIRGTYGEGTSAQGNLYQVSNQVTLGRSEEEIIDLVGKVVKEIVEEEAHKREALRKKQAILLEDEIYKAFGTLKYARVITSKEALAKLSLIRMGADMKILPDIPMSLWNKLVLYTQPAHVQVQAGKELEPHQRDIYRAKFIREHLASIE